ncbi:MAG: leucine-rich repeat domain-containing protein [Gemmatimonadota bacterium]|nr:leucine-rich repeat domain-containing protein [Gemmatimonadota bacterium]
MRPSGRSACAALAALALGGGCGGDPAEPEPVATAIAITPATATLEDAGETVQLTAKVTDQKGQTMTDVEVAWSTDDSLVAEVSASGLVEGGESGKTTVRASLPALAATATVTVEPGPRAVLHAVHRKMNGDDWIFDLNWKTDAPLDTWHGVFTDTAGNVTTLALQNNGVAARIAPEIGMLRTLVVLSIYDNELTGPIPPEIGGLENLEVLTLFQNGLTGRIPPELGNLRNLRYLNLSRNELTGAIPPEIGSLDGLDTLNLSRNELTGPVPPEIGNLRNLLQLKLDQNTLLSGRLPRELIGIPLVWFTWYETDLCYPADQEFQRWLWGIRTHSGNRMCSS